MYAMRSSLPSFGALGTPPTNGSPGTGLDLSALLAALPQFLTAPSYPQLGMQVPDWAALLAHLATKDEQPTAAFVPTGGDYNWQGFGP